MRAHIHLVLALCAVGAIAGCTAPLGGPATQTETPIPSKKLESNPGLEVAPGLSAGGGLDAHELAAAHSQELENRSFTWWERENRTGPDGETASGSTEGTVANETTYRYVRDTDDVSGPGFTNPVRNYSAYANGSNRFVRAFVSGTESGTVVIFRTETIGRNQSDLPVPSVSQYLESVENVSVSPISIDGQRRYRIDGSVSTTVLDGDTVRNYSLEAVVTPSGLVRTLTITYREGSTRVRHRFAIERVGDVTVEKPAWLSSARKN